MSIAAVIVTYNRLDFLKELVQSITSQSRKPDEIIVINNSSTDGTAEWLAGQDNVTTVTQDNVGGAGGQYTGILTAYLNGHDYIWIMDDDVLPAADCLEKLEKYSGEKRICAPLRYTVEGKPFFNDAIEYDLEHPFRGFWRGIISEDMLKNDWVDAVGLTFEGPLFHRSVLERIGLPEKKFFIYGDDTEYFIRASKAGCDIGVVTGARMDRKLPSAAPEKEFTWKHFYIVRNLIAMHVLHGTLPVRIIRPWIYLLKWLKRARTPKNMKTVFKAFFAGYFYKSGNPTFEEIKKAHDLDS